MQFQFNFQKMEFM